VLVDKALAGATKGVQAVGPATPAVATCAVANTDDCLPVTPPDKVLAESCKTASDTGCSGNVT